MGGATLDYDHAWIIVAGALIGHVRLDRVDLKDKRASLAVGIDDSTQLGKGLGSEAITVVLGYAFQCSQTSSVGHQHRQQRP
jgi:RimJ/RimL family protein N-acetyltransferase